MPKKSPPGPRPPHSEELDLEKAIEQSFAALGGAEWLVRQADAVPSAYLTLLGKILPREIKLDINARIEAMTPEQREAEAKRMYGELFGGREHEEHGHAN